MDAEQERTLYVGNLHEKVTKELLYELFLQAGPIENISRPKDKESGKDKNFAFILFTHTCSVPYAVQLTNGIKLYNYSIKSQARNNQIPPHYNNVGVHSIDCELTLEKSLNGTTDEVHDDSAYHSQKKNNYRGNGSKHDKTFRPKPLDPKQTWRNNILHHEDQQRTVMNSNALSCSLGNMTPNSQGNKKSRSTSQIPNTSPFGSNTNTPKSASHYHNMNSQILNDMSSSSGSGGDIRSRLGRGGGNSFLNHSHSMSPNYQSGRYGNNSYGSTPSYNDRYHAPGDGSHNSRYNKYQAGDYNSQRRNASNDGHDRSRSRSNDRRYNNGHYQRYY